MLEKIMTIEPIIPIIVVCSGAILTWIFKEINEIISNRKVIKDDLGTTVYQLIIFKNETDSFIKNLNKIPHEVKSLKDLIKYFNNLGSTINNSLLTNEYYDNCYYTIDKIAIKYPILASKLKVSISLQESIWKILKQMTDLNNIEEDENNNFDIIAVSLMTEQDINKLSNMELYYIIKNILPKFHIEFSNKLKKTNFSKDDYNNDFLNIDKLDMDNLIKNAEIFPKEIEKRSIEFDNLEKEALKNNRNNLDSLVSSCEKSRDILDRLISKLSIRHNILTWINYKAIREKDNAKSLLNNEKS